MSKKYKVRPEQAEALKDLEAIIGRPIPHGYSIEEDTFGVTFNDDGIVRLKIHYEWLTTLPESIKKLKSIKELNLAYTRLTNLPESITRLTSLQKLNLRCVNLLPYKYTLSEIITRLTSLKVLDLGSTQLMNLPESIGKLSSLQELNLSSNKLTTLPESIGKLSSLQELNLSSNQLATLPESIGNLKALQKLNLERNDLSTLPKSIGNLTSLKELNLKRNQLTTLPESIGDLSSLKKLSLIGNDLSTLPESFSKLKSLEYINLKENKWEGEWKEMAKNHIPTILKLCRKLNGITIFISHALDDQELYHIVELKNYLENEVIIREQGTEINIIHDVCICEEDLVEDIQKFMTENVPKSHLLIFIATNNSIASKACRYELSLAGKYGVEILPIKGTDITWENLGQIDLSEYGQEDLDLSSPKERFEFDGKNFDKIFDDLREYNETHESELKKSKKEIEELEIIKKNIIDIIKLKDIRDVIKDNLDDFNRIFQEVNNDEITILKYLLKLGEILNIKI